MGGRFALPLLGGLAIAALLVTLTACGGNAVASEGTVDGTVVTARPCPVESSIVPSGSASPPSSAPADACEQGRVADATVRVLEASSQEVRATVKTGADGTFTFRVPEGLYRLEATPASPAAGHGVPLEVRVQANSTLQVTLRIDSGVQ